MLLRAFCETNNVLQMFYFINMLVKILCYVVTAILILMLTIDVFKNVMSGDEGYIKKNMKVFIKRIIFAALIFFIPMIVNIAFGLLGSMNVSAAKCYNNANLSTIQSLKEKETRDYEVKKEKEKQEKNEKINTDRENEAARRIEIEKAAKNSDNQRENIDPNVNSSEKIAQAAEVLAWPYGTSKSIYYCKGKYDKRKRWSSWSQLGTSRPTDKFQAAYDQFRPNHFNWGTSSGIKKYGTGPRIGASCDVFVATAVRYSGYDLNYAWGVKDQKTHLKKSDKWKIVSSPKRGDICITMKGIGNHVRIYLGDGKSAEAGLNSKFGIILDKDCPSYKYVVFRATK